MAQLSFWCLRPGAAIKFQIGLVFAIFLAFAACQSADKPVVMSLNPEAAPGQTGTATLTAEGSSTRIILEVTPRSPEDEPQPVHIHFGTCGPNLGSVHYPLEDVSQGKSETLVEALLTSLQDGNHVINLHKSYDEIRVYTACESIPR